ncbi:MAG: hypothetical protein Q7S76_01835 [bacterium]|nr:hypothetical protein [bacterium]
MKAWEKWWLFLIITYSTLHLVRDIFQDLGVKNLLSTVLVKTTHNTNFIFPSFYTYIIAMLEIVLSVYCLRRNKLGLLGKATVGIAVITLIFWSVYWVYL